MSNPKLSIGLPVYNGAKYLSDALDSLLCQEFNDFELIISDNGSNDDTEDICRNYAKLDERVRYYRSGRNRGAAWNYNQVVQLSHGKYFKWATHDDICLQGFLSESINILDYNSTNVVLVYTKSIFIDEEGNILRDDPDILETKNIHPYRRLAHILHNVNMANAIFGVIRSDALRKTRLIDTFIASDYVLLAELAMLGEFWEVNKSLYLRRLHGCASRYANLSNKQVASWFDPNQKLKAGIFHYLLPRTAVRTRLVFEWLRSASRIPMSPSERIMCIMTVPIAYGISRIRCYGGLWKGRVRKLLGV